jgi:hypothetical protein
VIHNFADDNGTNDRTGVDRVERNRELRWELLFANAVDVATEADAVGGCAKTNSVPVACEVGGSVAGGEVERVAAGIEGKVEERRRRGIEICFSKNAVTAR